MAITDDAPLLSVVLPVYNEEACIRDVVTELADVLNALPQTYELLAVNDGSRDATAERLVELQTSIPELRILTLDPNSGQSAAFGAGFQHARGNTTIIMDADGQNDPADIPALLETLETHDCCFGYRANRNDTWSKRIGSRIGNGVRNATLGENIIDTGCSLKAFPTAMARKLPMFDGMHRFFGSLLAMQGASIAQIPVNHRARSAGTSKYTNFGRLLKTVPDLLSVRWMKKRYPMFSVQETS